MPLLSVDNVSKMFGGLVAIRNLSFEVERGEIVGMIGPNGAGKTTTFEVISGFQPATEMAGFVLDYRSGGSRFEQPICPDRHPGSRRA